jgi:hypothetical protein
VPDSTFTVPELVGNTPIVDVPVPAATVSVPVLVNALPAQVSPLS